MQHDNNTIDPEGFLLVTNSWDPKFNSFSGKVRRLNGTKSWYKNGRRHREDGPAIEHTDGSKRWYKNGRLHREDGPAVEDVDNVGVWYGAWYKNGQLHREDGPAVKRSDGSTEWWYDGNEGLENFPHEIKKNLARKFLSEAR